MPSNGDIMKMVPALHTRPHLDLKGLERKWLSADPGASGQRVEQITAGAL